MYVCVCVCMWFAAIVVAVVALFQSHTKLSRYRTENNNFILVHQKFR